MKKSKPKNKCPQKGFTKLLATLSAGTLLMKPVVTFLYYRLICCVVVSISKVAWAHGYYTFH